jgi:hypothetical protein
MTFATILFLLTVGPFTWAVNLYHSVLHAVSAPVDVVEYVTAQAAKGAAKLDYYIDEANGEDQAVKATKAQAKAAKARAKAVQSKY